MIRRDERIANAGLVKAVRFSAISRIVRHCYWLESFVVLFNPKAFLTQSDSLSFLI